MSDDQLAAILAERFLGWGAGPDRFLMGKRGWMPRWRFRPTDKLADAFRLLEAAAPTEYSISGDDKGNVHVCVRIGGSVGEARATCKPLAISYALARAAGVEVDR
jgi:hypothetical protein